MPSSRFTADEEEFEKEESAEVTTPPAVCANVDAASTVEDVVVRNSSKCFRAFLTLLDVSKDALFR